MLHCGLYAFKAFIFWNIRISVQDLVLAIYSLLDMINKKTFRFYYQKYQDNLAILTKKKIRNGCLLISSIAGSVTWFSLNPTLL